MDMCADFKKQTQGVDEKPNSVADVQSNDTGTISLFCNLNTVDVHKGRYVIEHVAK